LAQLMPSFQSLLTPPKVSFMVWLSPRGDGGVLPSTTGDPKGGSGKIDGDVCHRR
jgi:hypothetical protein